MGDGTRAGAGGMILTRGAYRGLRGPDGSWVKTGDRWCLMAAHADGGISTERHRDGPGATGF